MEECFRVWFKGVKEWRKLPCYVCWELWKHKNALLFEGKTTLVWMVVSKISRWFGELRKEKARKNMRLLRLPTLNYTMLVGSFDGASQ